VEIKLQEVGSLEQIARLSAGDLDVGFFFSAMPQIRGLDVRLVERCTFVAAIPEDWPLAKKERLVLADLARLPMLLFPAASHPDLHAMILGAFHQAGVTLNITQEAAFDNARLKLVAAGVGLSLVNRTAAPRGYPGVALRRIDDLPNEIASDLVMAWRRSSSQSARRLFLGAYEAVKAAVEAPPP
jgi:DNA-binding transcriptional LysR family regulator